MEAIALSLAPLFVPMDAGAGGSGCGSSATPIDFAVIGGAGVEPLLLPPLSTPGLFWLGRSDDKQHVK